MFRPRGEPQAYKGTWTSWEHQSQAPACSAETVQYWQKSVQSEKSPYCGSNDHNYCLQRQIPASKPFSGAALGLYFSFLTSWHGTKWVGACNTHMTSSSYAWIKDEYLYFVLIIKSEGKHSSWIPTCSGLPGLWCSKGNYSVHLEKRCYNSSTLSIASKFTLALWKLAFASMCQTQAGTRLAFLPSILKENLCVMVIPSSFSSFFFFPSFLVFFYKNNREREASKAIFHSHMPMW